eukprot:TRINITY_DN5069_c0_g1_i2.p1 TRINITY_DN5069_c0_g1~~TRINITY_DN5069_c0_g1_i2.p1  ORF type:complete len:131 (-),score=31.58 TRINITY_DN5069_c0_g1_i2:49-441(-)
MATLAEAKQLISFHADFPIPGITFCDIHPIMANAQARATVTNHLHDRYKDQKIDIVVGLESRGYYFGLPLADKLGVPFVPLRKKGKLPGELFSVSYGLEYKEKETIEVQKDKLPVGSKVLIVDDLLVRKN